ncbi:MAG: hypothetical protein CFE44_08725 [Burkholderiales bacterium PBB4]|nr:MAG: hypothetical protein CFE44_08725 [Burkholderiales bacterium PBB4]
MLHPIFRLIATQPQLLGHHAQAYGELLGSELSTHAAFWGRRALLSALALCLLGVSLVLAGVAVMMWGMLTPDPRAAAWVLWAVPLVPALAGLGCYAMARRSDTADALAFAELRRQVQADLALLDALSRE